MKRSFQKVFGDLNKVGTFSTTTHTARTGFSPPGFLSLLSEV